MADALKGLWKRAFGDSDEYIDLFFTHRFAPDETLVALEGDSPVSMLFLLPLTLCAGEAAYDARYIYAVATHPDHRSRGYSGALLAEAHRTLAAQGVDLSLLVPASDKLFAYYGARGYQTKFFVQKETFTACPGAPAARTTLTTMTQMAPLRNERFSQSALFARWDAAALAYQDRETALLGGAVLYFETPSPGYALCHPTPEAVFVKEMTAECTPQVLNAIARYFSRPQVQVRCSAFEHRGIPFAMTCWYTHERKESAAVLPPHLSLVLD